MQQTSSSSLCWCGDGDDFDVDSVDEVALDEVAVVVVSFLFMVCGNCKRLLFLIGRISGCVSRWGEKKATGSKRRLARN